MASISASENVKDFLSKLCNDEKYKKWIIVCGLIGIALIFLSGFFKGGQKTKDVDTDNITTEQYISSLEQNLVNIVSSIYGAGKTKVLVTLENGKETVYATEEKKNKEASEDKANGETTRRQESDDSEKRYITIKNSDGTEMALAVTELQPTIKGVVVVCAGGDNPDVKERIVSAVTTALNITSKRVCVTKLS